MQQYRVYRCHRGTDCALTVLDLQYVTVGTEADMMDIRRARWVAACSNLGDHAYRIDGTAAASEIA